jgi:hypothetical protein
LVSHQTNGIELSLRAISIKQNNAIIGQKLSHHFHDANLLPHMEYGFLPGHQCLSAVLNKVIYHDYIHLMKMEAAFIENDAIGVYNHLVNKLILMMLQKLGFPPSVSECLGMHGITWFIK